MSFSRRCSALARAAAADFQFGFARPASADAAHQAAHHGVLFLQPRQAVAQLGQLDLQLGVAAARALGEDVQNQNRPIDDLEIGEGRDGVGLARRQIGIEDEHAGVVLHGAHEHVL